MADYRKMYISLIDGVEIALEAIEGGDCRAAADILTAAECECEDIYIETDEQLRLPPEKTPAASGYFFLPQYSQNLAITRLQFRLNMIYFVG